MIQSVLENIDCTVTKLTCKDTALGFKFSRFQENITTNNIFINNVILQGKFYLWKCRAMGIKPLYIKFRGYVKYRTSTDKSLDLLCNYISS